MIRKFVQQLPDWDEYSEVNMETGMIVGYRISKNGVRYGEYSRDVVVLGWTSPGEFIGNRRTKVWGWTEI